MAFLQVIEPGLQTTIQDAGRIDAQRLGFPASGSVDRAATRLANLLVGNAEGTAVLEFPLVGPTLEFERSTFIALTGAQFKAELNHEVIPMYQCLQVQAGDILKIGPVEKGRIGYLAVAGGIRTEPVLGSRSTTIRLQLGGFHGRALAAGDLIPIKKQTVLTSFYHRQTQAERLPNQEETIKIRLIKGPQWQWFNHLNQQKLVQGTFKVTNQADRMGYRLEGTKLQVPEQNLLSTATVKGALQIPQSGEPIVLMADRQTTGGYPVIAVIATVDLGYFAQCQAGQKIQFELITLEQAQQALNELRQELDQLEQNVLAGKYRPPYGISRVASQRISRLLKR